MTRTAAVHFDTRPIEPSEEIGVVAPATRACGAKSGDATTERADVTCGNCKRRMPPAPAELVQYSATFHDNPNIADCPECMEQCAEVLLANPGKEPEELELPHCEFCGDVRLVYVTPPVESVPPSNPETSP